MTDAVVIGAGPNGLVAANLLADAGWDVLVLEAQAEPGGAVRSAAVTVPGYVSDLFSAFYPLAYASPVIRALGLERYGLRWLHAPLVLAHPTVDGRCAIISRDLAETAASVESWGTGDGHAWEEMYAGWSPLERPLLNAILTPFPPVRAGLALAAAIRPANLARFLRFGLLPVRRYAEEEFSGGGGGLLLAGNALHTDLGPESAGSAIYGWLLAMLGQSVGWPVPAGGAGRLTAAMVDRLRERGGRVECGASVERVEVRGNRAVGVRTTDGRSFAVRRAVLADVDAPRLYLSLVGADLLPPRLLADLRRFQWDNATVKVDWALSAPVPWTAESAGRAGTVHVGGELDELSAYAHELAVGLIPARPFVLFGQMTTTDPSRSPAGTESAWGYTHVPQRPRGDAGGDLTGRWDERETDRFVDRLEARVEEFAPGFRGRIVGRHVQSPLDLERADANLRAGALGGGTAAVHQQLFLRPTPGLGVAQTPIAGLYLASASAHPGGGVHGAPGANAARAALRHCAPGRRMLTGAAVRAATIVRSGKRELG
ncbi:MAG: phytoene desaturase family protein [Mycobacteriales bacterium]